jgi:hypothetical protein
MGPTSANPSQLQLKTKTAGKDWFDLPAPAEADLPRLHREYEALRLRNNLDPKRFYRKDEGEGKGVRGLPKYFAVRNGTVDPNERTHSFYFWNRLGQSSQQRRPSENHRTAISHAQSVNVR